MTSTIYLSLQAGSEKEVCPDHARLVRNNIEKYFKRMGRPAPPFEVDCYVGQDQVRRLTIGIRWFDEASYRDICNIVGSSARKFCGPSYDIRMFNQQSAGELITFDLVDLAA